MAIAPAHNPADALLQGWLEITRYMRRAERTLRLYVRTQGLPVTKFGKHVVTSRFLIDQWLITRAEFKSARHAPSRWPSAEVLGRALMIRVLDEQGSPYPQIPEGLWVEIGAAALDILRRQ